MGCGVYWNQVREIERALGTMRTYGISELSPAYLQLSSVRGKLLRQVGLKAPRGIIPLLKLAGLSPGEITIFHDLEAGWLAMSRERPGATPVYHYVSDEIAMTILKGDITHEDFETLKVPDPYAGE